MARPSGYVRALRGLGCASAVVLFAFSILADEGDEAACGGKLAGDACVLDSDERGICQPDDVDEEGLECDAPELAR